MAITQLNDYAIGDIDLTAIVETLDKTYKGKAEITLSEYDTTSAPVVKVGSVFENNGALFVVDSADIPPTGYSGISVSTTFYLYYDESGSAFIYSATVPTWSDSFQGWYNGNDRAFFSMYKDSGGTLYRTKLILLSKTIQKTTSYNPTLITLTGDRFYHQSSGNFGVLYDKLSPLLYDINDGLVISGSISNAIISKAIRTSSTEITIYGISIASGNTYTATLATGSGTSSNFSLAW